MTLNLSSYKPASGTSGDANQIANGFQAIQDWANGLTSPGYEYAYTEFTANKSVTATVEASADVVVTAGAVTFDGGTIALVEFSCPFAIPPGGGYIVVLLFEDGVVKGQLGRVDANAPMQVSRRLTPAAGSRTYSARAIVNAGTGTLSADVGGSAKFFPGFIRVSKV